MDFGRKAREVKCHFTCWCESWSSDSGNCQVSPRLQFFPFSKMYSLEGSHYKFSLLQVKSYSPLPQGQNIYTNYSEFFCIRGLSIICLVRKLLLILTNSSSIALEMCQVLCCFITYMYIYLCVHFLVHFAWH